MKMEKVVKLMVVAALVAGFGLVSGGCAQQQQKKVEETKTTGPAADTKKGMPESLSDTGKRGAAGDVDEGRTSRGMKPIYFDFDKSNIREDQKSRMKVNADFLKGNTATKIRVEGNCDERGTNEYNMALGERRANAAKKYLSNLGIDAKRMETVSYGEEKPLNHGHDELAWSQNRRDDFVIAN